MTLCLIQFIFLNYKQEHILLINIYNFIIKKLSVIKGSRLVAHATRIKDQGTMKRP